MVSSSKFSRFLPLVAALSLAHIATLSALAVPMSNLFLAEPNRDAVRDPYGSLVLALNQIDFVPQVAFGGTSRIGLGEAFSPKIAPPIVLPSFNSQNYTTIPITTRQISVPEGGTTIGLFAVGLLATFVLRRKLGVRRV